MIINAHPAAVGARRMGMNDVSELHKEGIDLESINIDNNVRNFTRTLLFSIGKTGGVGGQNTISTINSTLELLFGDQFVREVQPDAPEHVRFDGEKRAPIESKERKQSAGEEYVGDPGMMAMSLRQIYETGRCTKPEFTRMSLASVSKSDRKLFIDSRVDVPANTFADGPQEQAAEAVRMAHSMHARNSNPVSKQPSSEQQMANFALGRGPRPS